MSFSLQHIFDKIALADNVQYLVRASYLEIYNEEIRDLLSKVRNLELRCLFTSGIGVAIYCLDFLPCFCQPLAAATHDSQSTMQSLQDSTAINHIFCLVGRSLHAELRRFGSRFRSVSGVDDVYFCCLV